MKGTPVTAGAIRATLMPDGTYELLGPTVDHADVLQDVVAFQADLLRKVAAVAELRRRMEQRLLAAATGVPYGAPRPVVQVEARGPDEVADPAAGADVAPSAVDVAAGRFASGGKWRR